MMQLKNAMYGLLIVCSSLCAKSDSLYNLSAQELKALHDESYKQYLMWKERQKDAIPRHLMRQQRQEAARLAHEAEVNATNAQRALDLKRKDMALLAVEVRQLENALRRAEHHKIHTAKNSNDWRQRSTTEKVESKLRELVAKLRPIQEAYSTKPYFAQRHNPLQGRV